MGDFRGCFESDLCNNKTLTEALTNAIMNIFAFLSVACQHGIINVEYEETNQVFIVTKLSQTRRCVAKKNFLSIDFEFQRFSYSLTYLQ